MGRHVALLRGINVGGNRKVAMADLRRVFESLGYFEVETLIQSGNVIFRGGRPTTDPIEIALRERLGIEVEVMIRSHAQLKALIDSDPFPRADRSHLHVGFMKQPLREGAEGALHLAPFGPEEVRFIGREMFLHLPGGMGRARLPSYLGRVLKVSTTVRSWNTTVKLLDLSRG